MEFIISENRISKESTSADTKPETQTSKYKNFRAITIEDHEPREVYQFFRDFNNLQLYMKGVEEIRQISTREYHWNVSLKTGFHLDWDVEITEDIPGEIIKWQSLPHSRINMEGFISFTPLVRSPGTIVRVAMDCDLPGGKLTEFAAMVTGENPTSIIQTNLRRLKAYLETGEIPTIHGQPSGREEISPTKH